MTTRPAPARTAAASRRTAAQIARTDRGPRPVPALRPTRAARRPTTAQHRLDSGLQVVTVRRPSSPLVQLRLRIPFGDGRADHAARAELLAETMMTGTAERDRSAIDTALALVGGNLGIQVNPQRLLLSGSVLAAGLPVLLDVVADLLTRATYRSAQVERERERLVELLTISTSQPATIARAHLQRHRFGDHPASREVPDVDLVAAVSAAAIRGLHRRMVQPDGAHLVLVGDLRPHPAIDLAAGALADWVGSRPAQALARPPAIPTGPVALHHRAGAVQSQTRLTAGGVLRTDPTYPAAQLANLVLGGYFSSRLVENLREDKGFTYHAHSALEFWPDRGALSVSYDTATDVTAAALLETRYELGRLAITAPRDEEVDAARTYAIGALASQLASQSGYASMLSSLAGSGLGSDWLQQHRANLLATTTEDVTAAAQQLFAPAAWTGIVVGDLDAIAGSLTRLGGTVAARP